MPQQLSKVELDEVSLVDAGANQKARVVLKKRNEEEIEKAPTGIQFVLGFPKEGGSEVQSVVFDSSKWDVAKAKAWLKEHDMEEGEADETENTLRFRQKDPEGFTRFRTITPGASISKALKRRASFSQITEAVSRAIREKYDVKPTPPMMGASLSYIYIRDMDKDSAIFEQDVKLYRCDYETNFNEDGELVVDVGERVPVEMVYQDVKKAEPEAFPDELINRVNNLRADVLKMNSCHSPSSGQFCSTKGGGGGTGGGGGGGTGGGGKIDEYDARRIMSRKSTIRFGTEELKSSTIQHQKPGNPKERILVVHSSRAVPAFSINNDDAQKAGTSVKGFYDWMVSQGAKPGKPKL